jgi:hypothetical protein
MVGYVYKVIRLRRCHLEADHQRRIPVGLALGGSLVDH